VTCDVTQRTRIDVYGFSRGNAGCMISVDLTL